MSQVSECAAQIGHADVLLLNKVDLVCWLSVSVILGQLDPAQQREIANQLRVLAPLAVSTPLWC